MKMLFNSSNTLIPCAMQSKIKIQDCHWLIQMVNRAQASTEWAPKSLRFVNWRNHRDGAVVFRAMIRVNRSTANVFIKRIFRADVAVFDHGIDGEADRTWGGGSETERKKTRCQVTSTVCLINSGAVADAGGGTRPVHWAAPRPADRRQSDGFERFIKKKTD